MLGDERLGVDCWSSVGSLIPHSSGRLEWLREEGAAPDICEQRPRLGSKWESHHFAPRAICGDSASEVRLA